MKYSGFLKSLLFIICFSSFPEAISFKAIAQGEPLTIQPLFEYPEAPEEIISLGDKSDWLMKHFWDKMNFKSKNAVDQNALNHAFKVYSATMPFADLNVANTSIASLLGNLRKNPVLLLQFTKAAEETIYGPRAEMWIDEVYIKFIKELIANKKIDETRKLRYRRQLSTLEASQPGQAAPVFSFITPSGKESKYFPMATPTIIEFGNPSCDDCRHAALKMSVNATLSKMVDKGEANVLFIIPDADSDWQSSLSTYDSKWAVGASDSVADIYDIRLTPTFYVVGRDGLIKAKNIPVTEAIQAVIDEVKSIPSQSSK